MQTWSIAVVLVDANLDLCVAFAPVGLGQWWVVTAFAVALAVAATDLVRPGLGRHCCCSGRQGRCSRFGRTWSGRVSNVTADLVGPVALGSARSRLLLLLLLWSDLVWSVLLPDLVTAGS